MQKYKGCIGAVEAKSVPSCPGWRQCALEDGRGAGRKTVGYGWWRELMHAHPPLKALDRQQRTQLRKYMDVNSA
jgi:hypothetical protein